MARRRFRRLPERASVVGAGSFGTGVALLLERAGVRTTLLCRTPEQAERMVATRENAKYLPGVQLPERLKIRVIGARDDQFHRADLVFLAVPSNALDAAIAELSRQGIADHAGVVAADIFTEVLALAELSGGRARTFVGRAGTGDLVATALAPTSRNRSAGELLSKGIPASEIPVRLGQAVEALETVPLLARAIERGRLK